MMKLANEVYYTKSQAPFYCGELNLHGNTVSWRYIMSLILGNMIMVPDLISKSRSFCF